MKSYLNSTLSRGPDRSEEKGNSTSGQRCSGSHQLFVNNLDFSHTFKHLYRLLHCRMFGWPGQASHGFRNGYGRIWHSPYYWHILIHEVPDFGYGPACGNRDQGVLIGKQRRDFTENMLHVVRLNGQYNDLRRLYGLNILI